LSSLSSGIPFSLAASVIILLHFHEQFKSFVANKKYGQSFFAKFLRIVYRFLVNIKKSRFLAIYRGFSATKKVYISYSNLIFLLFVIFLTHFLGIHK